MNEITLSYVLTTYNKLPFLKEVIRLLLQNRQADEEIIVTDGGSTDGTKEFLQNLYEQKLIHRFLSEKDKGEAHGFNKAICMARGELIKIVTDDDVYHYGQIREMKAFMLQNPSIDAVTGNILSVNVMQQPTFVEWRRSYQLWFEQWVKKEVASTFFSCLPLMVRRSAVPAIGLFDTSFKHIDLEYSVRLTATGKKIAFCTGIVAIGLVNSQSVSAQESSYTTVLQSELKRLKGNFNYLHRQGIQSHSTPWIRKHLLRHRRLQAVCDRYKLFPVKYRYHPAYDVKTQENILFTNHGVPEMFNYFENYVEKNSPLNEKSAFIVS